MDHGDKKTGHEEQDSERNILQEPFVDHQNQTSNCQSPKEEEQRGMTMLMSALLAFSMFSMVRLQCIAQELSICMVFDHAIITIMVWLVMHRTLRNRHDTFIDILLFRCLKQRIDQTNPSGQALCSLLGKLPKV
jgi:hypothetical protein